MLLQLLVPACVAFVAPPLLKPLHTPPVQSVGLQSRTCITHMGLFDNLKGAFENNPKVAQQQAKEREESKKKAQKSRSNQKDQPQKKVGEFQTGNERVDELISGWTWK